MKLYVRKISQSSMSLEKAMDQANPGFSSDGPGRPRYSGRVRLGDGLGSGGVKDKRI